MNEGKPEEKPKEKPEEKPKEKPEVPPKPVPGDEIDQAVQALSGATPMNKQQAAVIIARTLKEASLGSPDDMSAVAEKLDRAPSSPYTEGLKELAWSRYVQEAIGAQGQRQVAPQPRGGNSEGKVARVLDSVMPYVVASQVVGAMSGQQGDLAERIEKLREMFHEKRETDLSDRIEILRSKLDDLSSQGPAAGLKGLAETLESLASISEQLGYSKEGERFTGELKKDMMKMGKKALDIIDRGLKVRAQPPGRKSVTRLPLGQPEQPSPPIPISEKPSAETPPEVSNTLHPPEPSEAKPAALLEASRPPEQVPPTPAEAPAPPAAAGGFSKEGKVKKKPKKVKGAKPKKKGKCRPRKIE